MDGLEAEKTWGKVAVGPIWDANSNYNDRNTIYWLKYALKRNYNNTGTGGAGAWTVVGSSDSVAAAMDAVDRWVAQTNLIWAAAGSAHSWIVLKQTGVNATGAGFQLCIDLNAAAADTEKISVVLSYSAGFTGGSTTARPTATDEVVAISAGTWGPGTNEGGTRKAVVYKTSDGACTRIYLSFDSVFRCMWFFDLPADVPAGWTTPVFAKVYVVPTYANLTNTFGNIQAIIGGSLRNCYAVCECDSVGPVTEGAVYQRPDALGNWLALPIGVAMEPPYLHSYLGRFYDLWFIATAYQRGDYLRGAGRPWDFVVIDDVVQPNDRTVFKGFI